jgi:surface polysaccharide O-acyltransferase-like enzyme
MITKDRIQYLDLLRVFSSFLVVMIHVVAASPALSIYSFQRYWLAGNLFDSFARPAVPIFIMISGVLLLNEKNSDISWRSFQKRLSRIGIPLLVWTLIYAFYLSFHEKGFSGQHFIELIKKSVNLPVAPHLGFLYLLFGLYLLLPFLSTFVHFAKQKSIQYLLFLWFLSGVLALLGWFSSYNIVGVAGFSGYLIFGHYLNQTNSKKINRYAYFVLYPIGLLVTFFGTLFLSKKSGVLDEYFYQYLSANVILMSAGIFLFFKNINFKFLNTSFCKTYLPTLSVASFGVFLIHPIFISIAHKFSSGNLFKNIFYAPFITIAIVLFSYAIILLFMKSKILNFLLFGVSKK